MKIEDKKLYFMSESVVELIADIFALIGCLLLYFCFDVSKDILIFASVLTFLVILSIPLLIKNIKNRVFYDSQHHSVFTLNLIKLSVGIIVNIYIIWYLSNSNNESLYFWTSYVFYIFAGQYILQIFKSLINLKSCFTEFNTRPFINKTVPINNLFSGDAIYIVKDNYVQYAFENYFTVYVISSKTPTPYTVLRHKKIYYKNKKLNFEQVQNYMVENNKNFKQMTESDIILVEMQNI